MTDVLPLCHATNPTPEHQIDVASEYLVGWRLLLQPGNSMVRDNAEYLLQCNRLICGSFVDSVDIMVMDLVRWRINLTPAAGPARCLGGCLATSQCLCRRRRPFPAFSGPAAGQSHVTSRSAGSCPPRNSSP